MEPRVLTPQPTLTLDDAADRTWDAIVVGAGPAGGLAAFNLARAGLEVLLVDKQCFPRYKVCGACLSPDAESSLRTAGLEFMLKDLNAVRAREFQMGVAGRTFSLPLRQGSIVSRDRMDAALAAEAVTNGCHFLPETSAAAGPAHPDHRVAQLQNRQSTVNARCRVLLIACGLADAAHGGEGKPTVDSRSHLGAGCNLPVASAVYEPGVIYMAVGRQGYVGQVLLEDGRLNVAAAVRPDVVRDRRGLGPTIGEMIEQAGLPCDSRLSEAHWKGTPMLTRRPASLCGRRLLLLGDAAGYVEPFTGEGIGWAMQSALAAVPIAVQAQSRWEPEMEQAWILQHRRLVRRRQWTCRMLASLLRRPRLIRASTSILSVAPSLATPIMYLLNRLPRQTATAS